MASHAPDTRWGADIANLTSNPSSSGHKYILVVTDYFTSQTWATPVMDIRMPTVTAAFEAIATANGPCTELNTYEGVDLSTSLPRQC